jgi:hypothetical protein
VQKDFDKTKMLIEMKPIKLLMPKHMPSFLALANPF